MDYADQMLNAYVDSYAVKTGFVDVELIYYEDGNSAHELKALNDENYSKRMKNA